MFLTSDACMHDGRDGSRMVGDDGHAATHVLLRIFLFSRDSDEAGQFGGFFWSGTLVLSLS